MSQTIWYHGTSQENVCSILAHGFREGTWFARHIEQALKSGGSEIFGVRVAFEAAPSKWQVCASNPIPASSIESHFSTFKMFDSREDADCACSHETYFEPNSYEEVSHERRAHG